MAHEVDDEMQMKHMEWRIKNIRVTKFRRHVPLQSTLSHQYKAETKVSRTIQLTYIDYKKSAISSQQMTAFRTFPASFQSFTQIQCRTLLRAQKLNSKILSGNHTDSPST